MPAGTKLEGDDSHASGSTGAESVDASEVVALCGLKPGYTSAFPAAELYPRE